MTLLTSFKSNYLEVHVRCTCDRQCRCGDIEQVLHRHQETRSRMHWRKHTISQCPQVRDSHHAIIARVRLNLLIATTIARHEHERL